VNILLLDEAIGEEDNTCVSQWVVLGW
jgi:hypothetical protein